MKNIKIVCAAVKINKKLILCGIRHWDNIMHNQFYFYLKLNNCIENPKKLLKNEVQGFLDNYGKFYTREQAFNLCVKNKQPLIHNPSYLKDKIMYSEDLY